MNNMLEALGHMRVKLLVMIINRHDTDKVSRHLSERSFFVQYSCLAQGTVGAELLEMLGLGTSDKSVMLCLSPAKHIEMAVPGLIHDLTLDRAGAGIMFTIPLQGMAIPVSTHLDSTERQAFQQSILDEVDKMNEKITHSMILALVNKGNSEEVVSIAKKLGATGGTVVNARRTGIGGALNYLGIPIQDEKELVAILVSRDILQPIMDAINDQFGPKTKGNGLILSVPVDAVAGMRVLQD